MPPRTLASLAHALGAASSMDAALVALGEALEELDRSATLSLLRYDGRKKMLRERLTPSGARVMKTAVETTFDHLPPAVRAGVMAGGQFVDLGDQSHEFARMFGFMPLADGGMLALRGMRIEGYLAAVLALYEPKKMFGTRATERFAPSAALFELAFARFAEREAREEAVSHLEDVTQRVHGEYVRKLGELESQLTAARDEIRSGGVADPARIAAVEHEAAKQEEAAGRAKRAAAALEQQVMAAVGQLEQAHIELHRRSEVVRQKTRSLYLIDRVLTIDAATDDPRQLADGLIALIGDDMQAQRCSLMLQSPTDADSLYIAAGRGLPPHVQEGMRIRIGEGIAGRVAASRTPLLVEDVEEATTHPFLQDQYMTTGSFISFPLVYHDQLVGVLNLTNRSQLGIYLDEDVERVRLLALVISIVAWNARLAERLHSAISVG